MVKRRNPEQPANLSELEGKCHEPAEETHPGSGAHRESVRDKRSARQRFLARARDMFGEPLAEVILTHDPEHLAGLSTVAERLSDEEIGPLREALRIATYLSEKEAKSTIQAWFVGLNPMLGNHEPALVIRDNPQAVRDAAQALLASG